MAASWRAASIDEGIPMIKYAIGALVVVWVAFVARAAGAQADRPTSDSSAAPAANPAAPPDATRLASPAPAAATGASSPSQDADRAKTESPPIPLATSQKEVAAAAPSWFARPPLEVEVGAGKQVWKVTIYGFIEAD